MNGAFILIWDNRLELSNKYKKILEQNYIAKVKIVDNQEDFFAKLSVYEPDVILISENVSNNMAELCQKIRLENKQFRPVILFLSKSSFDEDKLNALNAGADDFLSEPIKTEEFIARIKAHLRRTLEENSNSILNLPNENYSKKIIRRTIKTSKNWAMLLLGIDNFQAYKEIYGDIPATKLLQAYSAIMQNSIEFDDIIGQVGSHHFLIITSSYKAEKLADYLNYAFDSIARKFYSKTDAEKNYILLQGENKAGCKIPIMTMSIGIINSELMNYSDEIDAINALFKVQKLAKLLIASSKVIDRPLICSDETCICFDEKKVVIIEQDKDLAYLLETTLKIQGFTPILKNHYDINVNDIISMLPTAIIIDRGNDENKSFDICKQIKMHCKNNIKIIFTDTLHEKDRVLSAGADLYMPKPYDLMTLFQWIYKLLD